MRTVMLLIGLSVYNFGFAQYNKKNLQVMKSPRYRHETSNEESVDKYDMTYTYKNLRLFPIIANDAFVNEHKDIGAFTTLKQAIQEKKIIITETGATHLADTNADQHNTRNEPVINEPINDTNDDLDNHLNQNLEINNIQEVQQIQQIQSNSLPRSLGVSGTVNTLFAKNTSADTIFIMAGEIVKGGKQDRVIGQDVVLAPGEKINLSAFCVEKSRWTTKENNQGAFTGYFNVTSMDIRKTVAKEKNQSEVWKKVDETTSANKATSGTHTYTELANSKDYQKELKEYLGKFEKAFENETNVIGVVAVTGDKVMGCDLFATNALFSDSYENLIHSYVTEAITNGKEVSISNKEVGEYLDKLLADESKQSEEIEKNGSIYNYNDKKLHITTY